MIPARACETSARAGGKLRDTFIDSHDLAALRQAIHGFRGSLLRTPGLGGTAACTERDGACLWMAYATAADPADLAEAINAYEEALRPTSAGAAPEPSLLINYGIALEDRFEREHSAADLDAAIAADERAVALTDPGSASYPPNLNSLALALVRRFDLSAQFADLRRSATLLRQAVEACPSGSRDLPTLRSNLAGQLRRLYEVSADPADLEAAIGARRETLGDLPSGSAGRLDRLRDLTSLVTERYERDATAENLQALIDVQRELVRATDTDDSHYAADLGALGYRLILKHQASGLRTDLDEAISHYKLAVALTPQDAPILFGYLSNLAAAAETRYRITSDRADLELATESLTRASDSPSRRSLAWQVASSA